MLTAEDAIWSICPNCMNIAAEWRGAEAHALWELIDADADFPLPNLNGWHVTLQDCWRMREYTATHDAVRSLLLGDAWDLLHEPAARRTQRQCGAGPFLCGVIDIGVVPSVRGAMPDGRSVEHLDRRDPV